MRAQTGTDLDLAARLLRENKLVAIPTETVYGLAANGLQEDAVLKIFQAKNRPFFDPLILHLASQRDLTKYVMYVPPKARQLALAFWPGPLTLVLPKRQQVPDLTTSGQPTVAVRMPSHPLTRQLLQRLDFPLAAPSANPFGYVSPTSARHVADQLGDALDYILDGGESSIGLESTIIGFRGDEPVLFRLGGLPMEDIERVVGPLQVRLNLAAKPDAPGQLDSHYSPATRLVLGDLKELIPQFSGKKLGVLSFAQNYREEFPAVRQQWVLSPAEDLAEAAKNLFRMLREVDQAEVDLVLAERVPDTGIGRAINDRLLRASAKKEGKPE
ncbi:L-threonylcarbamoyladenylate synthase [soil metagenome]